MEHITYLVPMKVWYAFNKIQDVVKYLKIQSIIKKTRIEMQRNINNEIF